MTVEIRDEIVEAEVPVRVRRYRPSDTIATTVVWAHGGGFTAGGLDMPEAHEVARALADGGVEVVSVDYRLVDAAVRYPDPQLDVAAVIAHEAARGPVVAGGASAGATLIAGAVARLAERRLPVIGVVLAYPLLHRVVPAPTVPLDLDGVPDAARFPPARLAAIVDAFAPPPVADAWTFVGDAVPASFPPTLILLSERDELRPSGEGFARELAARGVAVEVRLEPRTLHGHLDEPGAPAFDDSTAAMLRWLRRLAD